MRITKKLLVAGINVALAIGLSQTAFADHHAEGGFAVALFVNWQRLRAYIAGQFFNLFGVIVRQQQTCVRQAA